MSTATTRKVLSIKPIAAFIHDESVIFWFDTPVGWTLLEGFTLLPKTLRIEAFEELLGRSMDLPYGGNLDTDGNPSQHMMVLPLSRTTMPSFLPTDAVIGMSSEFASDPVPHIGKNGEIES